MAWGIYMRHYLNILSFYFELSNIVTPFLGYNFFLMVLWIFWCYLRILVFAVKTITIIIFFNTFSPFFMRAWQRYDVICSKLVICLSLIPGIFHVLYIILHTGINRPPAWSLSKQRSSYILLLWDVVAINDQRPDSYQCIM